MSDLDEIVEAHSKECGLGEFDYMRRTYPFPCLHLSSDSDCTHPAYIGSRSAHNIGCCRRKIIFIRKIDYLNWKMTDGDA